MPYLERPLYCVHCLITGSEIHSQVYLGHARPIGELHSSLAFRDSNSKIRFTLTRDPSENDLPAMMMAYDPKVCLTAALLAQNLRP